MSNVCIISTKEGDTSKAVKRAKERKDRVYIGRVPIPRCVRYLSNCVKVRDTLNIEMADLPVMLPLAICRPLAAAVAGG